MSTPAASVTGSPQLIEEEDTFTDNGGKGSGNDEEDGRKSSSGDEADANDYDVPTDGKFVKEEIMKPETSASNAADSGYFASTNHTPFPPETLMSTTLGKGKVIQYI